MMEIELSPQEVNWIVQALQRDIAKMIDEDSEETITQVMISQRQELVTKLTDASFINRKNQEEGARKMTIRDLATNWMENDRTGDYCYRQITLEEARNFVSCMDEATVSALDEQITPWKFMNAWNSLIDEQKEYESDEY